VRNLLFVGIKDFTWIVRDRRIYEIMTGASPHEGVPDEELSFLYLEKSFPDVTGLVCGELIKRCWHEEIDSAEEMYNALRRCFLDLQTVT